MPGVLLINLTFVSGILCGISSGIMQGKAEDAVRKEKPGEFPPTPVEIALAAWKAEREKLRAELRGAAPAEEEPSLCPGPKAGPETSDGRGASEAARDSWADVEMGAAQPPAVSPRSSGVQPPAKTKASASELGEASANKTRVKTSVHHTSGDL